MHKLIIDSDALIKLTKADLINALVSYANCIITQEIYDEVVTAGKERHYQDAYIIEALIQKNSIKLTKVALLEQQDNYFGLGEVSALALYKKIKADAIISDDKRFTCFLQEQHIPFLFPIDTILLLKFEKIITKTVALNALEKINSLVRVEQYLKCKEILQGD